jgi:hypothetical protein
METSGQQLLQVAFSSLPTLPLSGGKDREVNINKIMISVPAANKTTNITTATTTLVFSGRGTLVGLVFNKRVATGVTTIYDSLTAAGTKVGTITVGASILTDCPVYAPYNRYMENGLTIVTSQAEDITVLWQPENVA